MAKKKNTTSIIVKIILMVLAAFMVVSIFTDVVTVKYNKDNAVGSLIGAATGDTHISGQDVFETMFEGHEASKEDAQDKKADKALFKTFARANDGEHKFICVMLEICFVVAVIAAIAGLVLTLLSLLGINLGLLNKIVALVFMIASVLTFIFALIVGNKMVDGSKIANGMAGIGAWLALIGGAGYGITYLATCNK